MGAKTKNPLSTINFELKPENLGKLYHYHYGNREVYLFGLKRIIEKNEYIQRATEIAATDEDLSSPIAICLFEILDIEIDTIGLAITGRIKALEKKRAFSLISAGTYFELLREIAYEDGMFNTLCKDSARRVLDWQNSLRRIEDDKPIIIYQY